MESYGRLKRFMVKYVVKLLRPRMAAIFLLPFTWGFAAGADFMHIHIAWYKILFAYLSFTLGSLFASSYNFYVDVETDRLHDDLYKDQPMTQQPFVTGNMGKWETRFLFTFTIIACFGFAALVNWRFLIAMPLVEIVVLGIVYNHPWLHFKAKPVVDIFTIALAASLEMLAGWLIMVPRWPAIEPLVWGFVFATTLYLPTVSNDMVFDGAVGYKTSAVTFGAKALINAMFPALLVMVAVAISNFIVPVGWVWRLLVAFGSLFAMAYTAIIHYRWDETVVHTRFNPWILVGPVIAGTVFFFVVALVQIVDT